MSNNYPNSRNERVSALDSTLELLSNIYKEVKHFLGVVFIDRALRSIVSWYDKRHPIANNKRAKASSTNRQDSLLKEEIESLNKTISKLKDTLKALKANNDILNKQIERLNYDKDSLNNEIVNLQSENMKVSSRAEYLEIANSDLMKRCLPENNIPSMIYYAQGDATGQNLRKVSTTKNSQHIYRIETIPGDTTAAIFEPDIDHNIQDTIENRNITLIACDILGIAPNASWIEVQEKGRASFRNNRWEVTTKAKIRLL